MKTVLVTLLLAGGLVAPALAQNESSASNRAQVGVRASGGLAYDRYKPVGQSATRSGTNFGMNGGLFLNVPLGESVSLQPGVNYSLRGGEFKRTDGNVRTEGDVRLSYLSIPVQLVLGFKPDQPGFFAGIGPEVGFALRGKVKSTVIQDGRTTKTSEKARFDKNNFARVDLGLSASVGYKFAGGTFINASYTLGLTDIDRTKGQFRNRYVGIGIGHAF